MDMMAQRYGQRPSALAGMDPMDPLAFDFDAAIMGRGMLYEAEAMKAARTEQPESGGGIPVTEAEDMDPRDIIRG